MDYNVIRCPRCGSVHLKAQYNYGKDKRTQRAIFRGIIPFIRTLIQERNEASAYWVCESCGNTFRMM